MLASIVIRTLNEAKYLDQLLAAIERQRLDGMRCEVIVVDSGSTDGTLDIARRRGCRLVHITREEFSFGRSLNMGCAVATGDALVMISGHCVPTDEHWLRRLCQPLADGVAQYSYGRQVGGPTSQYSECRIFAKYYPEDSAIPQRGIFCNNANAAVSTAAWTAHRFNEDLTGLEDMELAQRIVAAGGSIAYVADACVFHHHEENWAQVKRRYEREAIALQFIMPQVHIGKRDFLRYLVSSIWKDLRSARRHGVLAAQCANIARYRFWQYWGSYAGNHSHRRLSHAQKDHYFYPQ
jgi:glycosyltransferase involved in cell wall biosynthesis